MNDAATIAPVTPRIASSENHQRFRTSRMQATSGHSHRPASTCGSSYCRFGRLIGRTPKPTSLPAPIGMCSPKPNIKTRRMAPATRMAVATVMVWRLNQSGRLPSLSRIAQ